ncbi:MAG: GNAT family N-acetyltransferase [Myxococcales bacterium]
MAEVVLELLSRSSISENVALSNAVGWPDTEAEWQVIHDAALVFGARSGGQLVGQGALGLFEGAGSIAKMVVAPNAQRQGIGGKILDRLLAEAEQRKLGALGLVATPFGKALYESRGFVPTGDVVIAIGTPRIDTPNAVDSAISSVQDEEQILQVERRFMTGSRAAVLRGRLRYSCATAQCAGGFALATWHEKGTRLAPIIAVDEPTARALARAIFRALPGPMRLDIPGERAEFRRWLSELGVLEKGVHTEMARGGSLPWNVPARFALATQAWG